MPGQDPGAPIAGLRSVHGVIEPSNPLKLDAFIDWNNAAAAQAEEGALHSALEHLPAGAREMAVQILASAKFEVRGTQSQAGAELPRQILFELAERFSAWIALQVQN
jgi:hypothetical protein